MRYRETNRSDQQIDISPLIDMVFILLIFFMVSTTFIKDMNLEIHRPGASTATVASSKAIRVYIDKSGETYVDGQPVRIWVIQSKLRDLLKVNSSQAVLVVTDEGVPAGRLVEVVDQCRMAGVRDVGVATEREAG